MWWCSSIFDLKSILYSLVLRGKVMYDNVFEKKVDCLLFFFAKLVHAKPKHASGEAANHEK